VRITYEVITPESAENGDAEERGFIAPGLFNFRVPVEESLNKEDWPDGSLDWDLRAAEIYLGRGGMEDSGRWFTTTSPEQNFRTGADTFYSLHPSGNTTPASYARLARIFCWKRR